MQLDAAIPPIAGQLRDSLRLLRSRQGTKAAELRQQSSLGVEIRPASIVRVDQVEVPELGALVDVGNSRTSQLERELDEAVQHADARDPALKRQEIRKEKLARFGIEQAPDELRQGFLIFPARIGPGCRELGLARGFHDIGLDAASERRERSWLEGRLGKLHGPRADEGLVE